MRAEVVEIEVAGGKARFAPCASRLELAVISSVFGEIVRAGESYRTLKKRFEDDMAGPDASKAIAGFAARTELERTYLAKTEPSFQRISAELTRRYQGGPKPEDYTLDDLLAVAAGYIERQSLTEEERKNAPSGSASSSPAGPR